MTDLSLLGWHVQDVVCVVLFCFMSFSYVFEVESETVESTVFSPFDLIYIWQMKVEPVWDAFCVLKTRLTN